MRDANIEEYNNFTPWHNKIVEITDTQNNDQ